MKNDRAMVREMSGSKAGFKKLVATTAGLLLVSMVALADKVDFATLFNDYTATNGTTLTGTLTGNYKISVADGATVTLEKVTIRGTNSVSCPWSGLTCEGDATLVLSGTNVIQGFFSSYPAIHVPVGKTLTIRGDGSLTASENGNAAGIGGGLKLACGNIVVEGGTVVATGGVGAGIGGGYGAPCGEIRITGGKVSATGGNGSAGIGGGYNPDGTTNGLCGDISITGGTVTAKGGDNGAGIGGGNKVNCGNISLTGGLISATGGKNAAGIGGGWMASCGDITITFDIDRVTATMGEAAIHIGAGYGGTCGTVFIDDNLTDVTRGSTRTMTSWDGYLATMTHDAAALDGMTLYGTLTGNYKVSIADGATVTLEGVTILGTKQCWWAGITCEGDATIVLSGANTVIGAAPSASSFYPGIYVPTGKTLTICGSGFLKASSSGSAAGIGCGESMSCGNIVIENGEIIAVGGSYSAGIGGAYGTSCGQICITGGRISATGGYGATAIGPGRAASSEIITITGGTIDAVGGNYAAGIGCGDNARCEGISISGGQISSTGGQSGAGIGSGSGAFASDNGGSCGNITISGGEITAVGSDNAAGIGGGARGSWTNISITGGNIVATGGKSAAGIGGGGEKNSSFGNISITGGTVFATGGDSAAGIGGGLTGNCNDITIGTDIIRVIATKSSASVPNPIGKGANSTCGTVSIEESLEQIQSTDGTTLTIQPHYVHTITWMNDNGELIDMTEATEGAVPTHVDPVSTQTVEAPYRYVFTGWAPDPVAATNDATYTATFVRVADLALLDGNWSPADGDILLPAETPYAVMVSPGVTVTLNGVTLASPAEATPTFAPGAAALITEFSPSEDGTWTLQAYGDLASGSAEGVGADMVQVYAADTVEGLATASPLSSGVVLKNTQNAVKTTLEVTPPTTSDAQFFRIQFSSENQP